MVKKKHDKPQQAPTVYKITSAKYQSRHPSAEEQLYRGITENELHSFQHTCVYGFFKIGAEELWTEGINVVPRTVVIKQGC